MRLPDVHAAQTPTGGRLAEVMFQPGGRSAAHLPDRSAGTGWWRVARAVSGIYTVRRPRDTDDRPTGRLVCPIYGHALADVRMVPGETAVVRVWCEKCRIRHTIGRIVLAGGDILLLPDLGFPSGGWSAADLLAEAAQRLGQPETVQEPTAPSGP